MPRLIDANEFKMCIRMLAKDIARAHGGVDDVTMALKEAFDMVDEQPTIDAEPVVRCRDCKHSAMWDDHLVCGRISNVMIGYYHGTVEVVKPDDFCSHGERREDHE